MQVIKYAIPNYEGQSIMTHTQKGQILEQTAAELFSDELYKSTVLRLLLQTDKSIIEMEQVPIEQSKKVIIEFSPDGQYLAVLMKKLNKLIIHKITNGNDILQFFKMLKSGDLKPYATYSGLKEFKGSKKLEFCQNSRYLAVYGHYQLHVI